MDALCVVTVLVHYMMCPPPLVGPPYSASTPDGSSTFSSTLDSFGALRDCPLDRVVGVFSTVTGVQDAVGLAEYPHPGEGDIVEKVDPALGPVLNVTKIYVVKLFPHGHSGWFFHFCINPRVLRSPL
jgi:hypothetical protein